MPRILLIITCSLMFGSTQMAFAGPLDEAKAKAHLQAVADGNLGAVMRDYTDDAYMDWVGGPLDGRYRGKAAIGEVWKKFIANNGGKPRPAKFGKPEAYSNPKGTTIETPAEYGGEHPVKAWHVLTYRDGSLVTEIWQIAPAIQVSP
ncbi:MAG: nuclear transport factor 2 family protein [Gammaproteobacteria bacterium]|nr:nuclear transport factor 2 family protein [Gammaproteobacteria bacterium]